MQKSNKTEILYLDDKLSRRFYIAGGIASFLFILYTFLSIVIMQTVEGGYPATAKECFAMLADNRFMGLIRLDILTAIFIPLYYIIFLSIYQAVKKNHTLISLISLFAVAAGVTIFLAGINISSIVLLSDKYQAATSPEIKQQLLAAGEAMLATDMWVNTGVIFRGILIETGAVILSILMLKTGVFNKFIGWVGIITHSFDLASVIIGIFNAEMKEIFIYVAGPLYLIWFPLVGIRLIKMGRAKKTQN
jgi:hypothetical protein